jgi:hypothetical protein
LLVVPTTLIFAGQSVGGTSPAQAVTVTNPSLATVRINGISIGADFAQTNTCSTSIAPQSSCVINISSRPTTPGQTSGTLTLTDNATNSAQVVTLSGKANNGKK